MKKVCFFLSLLVCVIIVQAKAPHKISYQAVVRDEGGRLIVNRSVSLKISIIQENKPVFVEIQKAVTNTNGVVSIEIGGVTPVLGDLSEIDWSKGGYYIKVEVDPNGGVDYTSIVATNPLLSVPYAMYSKNAEDLKIGVDSLSNKLNMIDGHETKIKAGDNILVIGSGTEKNPYVISDAGSINSKTNEALALKIDKAEVDFYNVTNKVPLVSDKYYSSILARSAVPEIIRKSGLIITYSTSINTWETEQFIGTNIIDWNNSAYWINKQKMLDDRIGLCSKIAVGKNLFDKSKAISGYFVNWDNGGLQTNASYCSSDFIPVKAGQHYFCNTSVLFKTFYDANFKFISGSKDGLYPVVVPDGAFYIRFSCYPSDLNTTQFEEGSVATAYQPYEMVINENLRDNSVSMSKLSPEVLKVISTAKNNVSSNNLVYDWDINMLPFYGQSLSVASNATNGSSNFRNILSFKGGCNESLSNVNINDITSVNSFYGEDLLLLSSLSNKDWSPVAASAIAWMSLLEKENCVDLSNFDYQFILSTPGRSGAGINSFVKGSDLYSRLLFSVNKAFKMAVDKGKTFGVPVLFWAQGESNANDKESDYYNTLDQLFVDLNADIKTITGQTKDVQFITYQGAPVVGVTVDNQSFKDYGPAFAQLRLAMDKENVHFGGSMYQFKYSDLWHPVDGALVGMQMGIQAKRLINDNQPLKLFYPKSYSIVNSDSVWILSIQFDVPVPPMRFDISGDQWHNPNGKQPNFGFTLVNGSNVSIIDSEPVIRRGNTLVFRCKEDPKGCFLSYAVNGHYGGGNLCDSQNIIINNKGVNYVIDNFCPSFRNYVIK